MRKFKNKYAYLICFLLSSCLSLSQKELTQNVLELPSMEKSTQEGMKSGYFVEGAWPEKEWWHIYGEEKLNQLMQVALNSNPNIQSIQQKVQVAKQNAVVVRSKLFPLLFFNYDETWQYLSQNGLFRAFNKNIPLNANLIDLSLSFNYEFDFWSKNLNAFRAAIGITKANEAEAAQVELITTTAVAQAYFALKTNMKKRELFRKITQVTQDILELQNLLKKEALFSRLTPLGGFENYQTAQKNLISISEEIQTNYHLLNILLGRGPDEEILLDEKFADLPKQIVLPSRLSLDLLSRRPDLMAQIWKVESFSKEVAIARADFYPSVNLMGLVGLESTAFAKLLHWSSQTRAIQPAINLPIFTAGAIRANVRSKMAAFEESVFQYNQLILQSTQEVADIISFAQSVFERKDLQQQIVSEAKELLNLIELRYEKGLDNLFAVYENRVKVYEKELEDLNLLYNQYLSSIRLIKSLGGGYISDLVPVKAQEVSQDGM
ncbi:MAG: efflux transporter outer membrane subunit [Chlamydiae bacterium]|nr:efflux transporter outer membrane subunit [Chlamydiota bacterium]